MQTEAENNPAATMRYLPGQNLILAAFAIAALSFGSFWFPPLAMASVIALCVFICISVYDFIIISRTFGKVQLELDLPQKAARAQPLTIRLRITSSATAPLKLGVRTLIPQECGADITWNDLRLSTDAPLELVQEIIIHKRGLYDIAASWLRVASSLNLINIQWQAAQTSAIKVYPESVLSNNEFLQTAGSMLSEKIKHHQRRGEGMEFDTLNQFNQGDDPRHIDWRASARHRNLLVKRHTIEQHRDIIILLDSGRLMGADTGSGTKLDAAINSSLMLCEVALHKGDRCGFGVFDDRIISYLPPQSGTYARKVILENVYSLQSDFRESNFTEMFAFLQRKQSKRALVIVISDLTDGDTTTRFRQALHSLAKRHIVVFAALDTPLLEMYATQNSADYQSLCQKSLALRLQRQRHSALHELSRSSVRIIDTLPKDLSAPLINEYLYLKEANLI